MRTESIGDVVLGPLGSVRLGLGLGGFKTRDAGGGRCKRRSSGHNGTSRHHKDTSKFSQACFMVVVQCGGLMVQYVVQSGGPIEGEI